MPMLHRKKGPVPVPPPQDPSNSPEEAEAEALNALIEERMTEEVDGYAERFNECLHAIRSSGIPLDELTAQVLEDMAKSIEIIRDDINPRPDKEEDDD